MAVFGLVFSKLAMLVIAPDPLPFCKDTPADIKGGYMYDEKRSCICLYICLICYTALMIMNDGSERSAHQRFNSAFYLLFFRVHEDNRHLLLSSPVLSSAGLQHSAAQSRLRVWDAPLVRPLWDPAVAEVRLSKDPRGETPVTF